MKNAKISEVLKDTLFEVLKDTVPIEEALYIRRNIFFKVYKQDINILINNNDISVMKKEHISIKDEIDAMKHWHRSKTPYIKGGDIKTIITYKRASFIFIKEIFYKCKYVNRQRKIKLCKPTFSYNRFGCANNMNHLCSIVGKTGNNTFGELSFLCEQCEKCKCGGKFRFGIGGCSKECFLRLLAIGCPKTFGKLSSNVISYLSNYIDLFTAFNYIDKIHIGMTTQLIQ